MKLAAIAAALVAGSAMASEPIAYQTCVMFDAGMVCAHVFEADLVLDSQPASLTDPVGIGFARVGKVADSRTPSSAISARQASPRLRKLAIVPLGVVLA